MGKKRATATERPNVGKSAEHRAHDETVDERLSGNEPTTDAAAKTTGSAAKSSKSTQQETREPYAKFTCEFGTFSAGADTARLGVRIAAENLNVDSAFELFVGKRLQVRCTIKPSGDANGQTYMVNDMHDSFIAVADVKRFGVSAKSITTGLAFNIKEIESFNLTRFAKRTGVLAIYDISDSAGGDEDDDSNY